MAALHHYHSDEIGRSTVIFGFPPIHQAFVACDVRRRFFNRLCWQTTQIVAVRIDVGLRQHDRSSTTVAFALRDD